MGDAASFKKTAREAFVSSIPVLAGYMVLGIGFGVVLSSRGYSWVWALVMSLTIYAGSLQYVTVDLLSAGAGLISVALMSLMVNARHFFYGLSMIDKYKNTGKKKPYLIFALTDETYSLVCYPKVPEGTDINLWYLLVSAFNQCYWVAGSVIGGILGKVLPFDFTGIDFSMTALFLVVCTSQWMESGSHESAIAGIASSVICLVVFGPNDFLIPAMICIAIVLSVIRTLKIRKGENV